MSSMDNNDEEWKKRGVEFKIIDEGMVPDVLEYLSVHFFPDEPISRSLGVNIDSFLVGDMYRKALKDGSSIAAVNPEGKVMGVRVGNVTKRSSWGPWIEDKFFALIKLLIFLMPKSIQVLLKLFQPQWLDFKPYKMLAELPCEVMYDDKAVSSARWHGVKGLGSELVRRSEDIARSRGCSHTYALVTGNYSAKIFDKLGHTLIKAVNYSDFKDSRGELYLKDTREHVQARVYLKAL